jgi:hypothetical protein
VSQGGEPPSEKVHSMLVAGSQPGPQPGSVAAPGKSALRGQEERIAKWLRDDELQLARIHELLLANGVAASYTTLREFVREAGLWKQPQTTMRMAEWPPGEAAEIDFGKLGMLVDATT